MNAIEQTVMVLTAPKPSHEQLLRQRRRERNRDYYARKKHIWIFVHQIEKLRALQRLLTGGATT